MLFVFQLSLSLGDVPLALHLFDSLARVASTPIANAVAINVGRALALLSAARARARCGARGASRRALRSALTSLDAALRAQPDAVCALQLHADALLLDASLVNVDDNAGDDVEQLLKRAAVSRVAIVRRLAHESAAFVALARTLHIAARATTTTSARRRLARSSSNANGHDDDGDTDDAINAVEEAELRAASVARQRRAAEAVVRGMQLATRVSAALVGVACDASTLWVALGVVCGERPLVAEHCFIQATKVRFVFVFLGVFCFVVFSLLSNRMNQQQKKYWHSAAPARREQRRRVVQLSTAVCARRSRDARVERR